MKEFIKSLVAFLKLYKAGFRIHETIFDLKGEPCGFYRFFWFNTMIKDFPDIDFYARRNDPRRVYNTMQDGRSEPLAPMPKKGEISNE
jgi:hypothetical protein